VSSSTSSSDPLPRPHARRFLALFFAGLFGTLTALVGSLALLDLGGRLPPPALSGRWELDATLLRWRESRPPHLDLLFAGSSAAFYGVDGTVVRRALGEDVAFWNAGVLGAKMHQTRFWLDFLLGLWPGVRQVVLMSTYIDFEACPPATARPFDPAEARALLERRYPLLYHHLRHLDLLRLARGALTWRPALALGRDTLEARWLEPWGGQVLDVPRRRVPAKVVRGIFPDPDPRCYAALGQIARELADRHIRAFFVQVPMRPGYLATFDPDGRRLAAHLARIRRTVAGTGMRVVDLHHRLRMPEEAFFDAYHLRAPWVRRQTEAIVALLRADHLPALADQTSTSADDTSVADALASASPAASERVRQISR